MQKIVLKTLNAKLFEKLLMESKCQINQQSNVSHLWIQNIFDLRNISLNMFIMKCSHHLFLPPQFTQFMVSITKMTYFLQNRKQISGYGIHLFCVGLLVFIDLWWYMSDMYYYDTFLRRGILAHIGGVIGGCLVGIHVFRSKMTIDCVEKYARNISIVLFFLLASAAIFVDLVVLRWC